MKPPFHELGTPFGSPTPPRRGCVRPFGLEKFTWAEKGVHQPNVVSTGIVMYHDVETYHVVLLVYSVCIDVYLQWQHMYRTALKSIHVFILYRTLYYECISRSLQTRAIRV